MCIQYFMNTEAAMNRDPHDPNKGLNVRKFSWAVVLALAIILAGALFVIFKARTKILPHAVAPRPNNSASPQ